MECMVGDVGWAESKISRLKLNQTTKGNKSRQTFFYISCFQKGNLAPTCVHHSK